MADEYVRTGEFGEFVKRMDERFDHVDELTNQRFLHLEKHIEQGLAHAEKTREQNFEHLNQRFDDANQRFGLMQGEIRNLRTTMVALHVPVIVAILGAVGKFLFFN